ncbi:MAG TPA: polyprenol monophosphomannose synthase [Aggregatilinea sp.]|jgi:dolichol-phosphate mannosyltransferase|uniref:polyprenol monophosphomannose synthase n=1 Tax=Aggregatilinea sp. TaxID=2806333 RepID=UPI002C34BF52|nr:polyprenol monophosphomannose synthase [Aggregatilinea sp.]HML23574.1 polyprenol monophosphomannose synthase [Aggregatilinea sp.]
MKIVVTLPTYNEAENIPTMIEALRALPVPDLSILVIDDNSPDGTGRIADDLAAKYPGQIDVMHRPGKNGLGTAYIEGFTWALAHGADAVLQMDSDFSHNPDYIPQMVETLERTGTDIVLGSRYAKGGSLDDDWGFGRKLLSWWANSIYVRLILHTKVKDATGGFRLWKAHVLRGMDLKRIRSNGYVFQVETIYVAEKLGYRAVEVPIHFKDRRLGRSKMSFRVQSEAALRVWQVWGRHRHLTPSMRAASEPVSAH